MKREDFPTALKKLGLNGTWVELGVCQGLFAEALLSHPDCVCKRYIAVDRWAGDRGHDHAQFMQAKERLSRFAGVDIWRMSFSEAACGLQKHSLDFVYADGYAHTGQDGGESLRAFWPLVKPGGVFAGHDYSERFPENIKHIDKFLDSVGRRDDMKLTDETGYKSWWLVK